MNDDSTPVITSASNDAVKYLRRLSTSSKARRETNTYIAEGIHLVRSFLATGQLPYAYACAKSALENAEVAQLLEALPHESVRPIILSDALFESIASIHASVGILIIFTPPTPEANSELRDNTLLLEDIQDPGNMGTILRTAAAAGITEIFTSSGSTAAWSSKALRAGMGAQFALQIHENVDLRQLITGSTVQVLATSLDASDTVYQKDLSQPSAWLFGNEGQGVSDELLSLNVHKVVIPQNPAIESLNVAASVAVCLFEQARQRSATG